MPVKQHYKKSMLIMLGFMVLFTSLFGGISPPSASAYPNNEQQFFEYLTAINKPIYNVDSYKANFSIYQKYNLIVYGSPKDVKNNQYKKSSLCGNSGGEYRYHGFNEKGGLVTNYCFPNDARGSDPPERWDFVPIPGATDTWPTNSEQVNYILNTPLQGHGATTLTVAQAGGRPYAEVLSVPTWLTSGAVRLEHDTPIGIYYATFTLPPMTGSFDLSGSINPWSEVFVMEADENEVEVVFTVNARATYDGYAKRSHISRLEVGYKNESTSQPERDNLNHSGQKVVFKRSQLKPGINNVKIEGWAELETIFGDIMKIKIPGTIKIEVKTSNAYVEAGGYADPGEVEYVGEDIPITVHVSGELKEAQNVQVSYWTLYAKRKEDKEYKQKKISKSDLKAETTFDFLVKSEEVTSADYYVDFDLKAKAVLKNGKSLEGVAFTQTYIYEGTPDYPDPEPEPRPPVAVLHVGPEFYWPQTVEFDDASYHPDAPDVEIVSRKLTVDGEPSSFSRNFPRVTEPTTKTATLTVTDENGLQDTDSKTFTLLPTTPVADMQLSGNFKVNRKITLDARPSTNATESSFIAPIDYTKTEWQVRPLTEGVTQDDIKFRVQENKAMQDILVRKPGKYEVTLRVTNIYGETSEPVTETFEVVEDMPPVADFTIDAHTQLRDGDGVAKIKLKDQSYSLDDDTIQRRIWYVEYDEDNDGNFKPFEGARQIISNGNEKEVIFETDKVGNYRFSLEVVEGFGQPTLEEFIRDEHYERDETQVFSHQAEDYKSPETFNQPEFDKVVEIDNAPPTIDFLAVGRNKVDTVLDFGGLVDATLNHLNTPSPDGGRYDHYYYTVDRSEANRLSYFASDMETQLKTKGIDADVSIETHYFHHQINSNFCRRDVPYQVQVFDHWEYKTVTNSQPYYYESGWETVSSEQVGGQYDGTRRTTKSSRALSTSAPDPDPPPNFPEEGFWQRVGSIERSATWDRYVGESQICKQIIPAAGEYWTLSGSWAPQSWINEYNQINGQRPQGCYFVYAPVSYSEQEWVWRSETKYEHTLRRAIYRWETHYRDENCPSGLPTQESFDATQFATQFQQQAYRSGGDRMYVRFDDQMWSWRNDSSVINTIRNTITGKNIQFWTFSHWNNKLTALPLIAINDGQFHEYYKTLGEYHVDYVKDYLLNHYLFKGDGQNITIVLGQQLDYIVDYDDLENDPEFKREWKFDHDPTRINGRVIDNQPEQIKQSGLWINGPLPFERVGTYTIQLRAMDDPIHWNDDRFFGYRKWSDEELVREYKVNVHRAPIAEYTFTVDPGDNYRLDLDPSPSYDPDFQYSRQDKGIVKVRWSYKIEGSPTSYNGQPGHIDPSKVYLVTLEVEDIDGAIGTVTKRIDLTGDLPPIALFEVQDIVTTDMILEFVDKSYSPMGKRLVQYDITVREQDDPTILWSGHDWPESFDAMGLPEGEYMIGLVVHDEDGRRSEKYERPILVLPLDPPVSLFDLPAEIEIGEIAEYRDRSYDPNNYPLINYAWTVELLDDDGNTVQTWQTGVPPTDFRDFGGLHGKKQVVYRVTQIVHNDPPYPLPSLQSAPYSREILVKDGPKPPYPYFTWHPQPVYEGMTFTLDPLMSYDPDGTVEGYEWTIKAPNGQVTTSTERFPKVQNARRGVYTVSLHVYDNDGLRSREPAVREIEVLEPPPNQPPVANFVWEPQEPHLGQEIKLNPDPSFDPDGEVVAWQWTIRGSDGRTTTSTEQYPTFIGALPYYDVTLVVRDDQGAASEPITKRIEVNVAKLTPLVTHTDYWSNYWVKRGYDKDVNIFKAGEKFIIRLTTTPAERVWGEVYFDGIGKVDIPSNLFRVVEKKTYEWVWEAELWQANFASIPPGEYLFHFWGMHPDRNPTQQSYGTYLIRIEGSIYDNFHRNF
jgi:PKD repeat protein